MKNGPRRMFVVPEPRPGTASVFVSNSAPVFAGEGDISYMCGGCGTVLIAFVAQDQIQGLIFKCPTCGVYNQIERPELDLTRQLKRPN